jgi:hypothetical protein
MHDVFLGGLPRSPASLAGVEAGLHDALVEFAGAERSAVKIRLHTKASGEGRGFGFAWLPDAATAQRLVEAKEIFFDLDGVQTRAGIRAAANQDETRRGPPPSNAPGHRLSITLMSISSIYCSSILTSFTAWQERLERFGIGLEVDVLTTPNQLERAHYCDVLLLLWRDSSDDTGDQHVKEWTERANEMADAGRTVLVIELAALSSQSEVPCTRSLPYTLKAAAAKSASAGKGSRVDVVTSEELHNMYPWRSTSQPHLAALHERSEAAAISTLAVRRAVARHLSSICKVFVTDCDGTLC